MSHKSTLESDKYDSDEPPHLELDLAELKKQATQVLEVECVAVEKLTKGARHEIFVLRFDESQQPIHDSLAQVGFPCIARFARRSDTLDVDKSEVATIRHVRRCTSVPVPEIYHEEYDPNHAVGAAYVLMEKLPGTHLYDLCICRRRDSLVEFRSNRLPHRGWHRTRYQPEQQVTPGPVPDQLRFPEKLCLYT